MKLTDKSSFFVVGIGLSIGGIAPLTEILSCLPVHSRAAFLIIQHLDRSYPSKLAERLQPFTKAESECGAKRDDAAIKSGLCTGRRANDDY
jgi:chemotaxis response regulator CheB